MPRRTKHHIGRVRIAAAKIIAANLPHLDIRPEDIQPASGSYRSNWRLDVYRWELFTRTKGGTPAVFGSWERLTDFVKRARKNGCNINSDSEIHSA